MGVFCAMATRRRGAPRLCPEANGGMPKKKGMVVAGARETHPNHVLPHAVFHAGFAHVGAKGVSREGVGGTKNAAEYMLAVAEVCHMTQKVCIGQILQEAARCPTLGGLTVCRHYGPTPARLPFGRLQDRVAPRARYVLRAAGQYRAVSDEEFRKRCPTRPTHLGKLDIMVQEAEFVLATGLLGPAACQEHHRVLCPPVILQRASASTIYTCVVTALSSATLGVATFDAAALGGRTAAAAGRRLFRAASGSVKHGEGVLSARQGPALNVGRARPCVLSAAWHMLPRHSVRT